MIKDFRNQLWESLNRRRNADLPKLLWIFSAVVIFTVLFCILSVYAVPSDKPPEFNFQDEGGAVTALSAIYLALASGFAIAANLIHVRKAGTHQWLWVIFAAGLAFLAFDELFQFHERFGRLIFGRILPKGFFRNWNDIIVIMYGVVAIPLVVMLLPRLLRYRMVPELFLAAFLFYAIHTVIDSTQEPSTLTSIIFEESAKLICAAFLTMATLSGLIGNIWRYVETNSDERSKASVPIEDTAVIGFDAEVGKIGLAN